MGAGGKKYVITGGPGSGKSTLVAGLQQLGYSCSAEVSRRMIIQEVDRGSDCLPWLDVSCFSVKVLAEMTKEYLSKSNDKITFFDRGIPDVIAYLHVAGLPVDDRYGLALAAHPYEKTVFILPPWEEIYVNDSERWQGFEESVSIYNAIRETYTAYGYTLIEVPRVQEAERIAFILGLVL